MRERPILFSGSMVRALLSGAKTQTRRVVKRIPWRPGANQNFSHAVPFQNAGEFRIAGHDELTTGFRCPYGQPGDRLWVRETWTDLTATHGQRWERYNPATRLYERGQHRFPWYRADGDQPDIGDGNQPASWRPSIHMPRWACRLVLEITDVRVERLQTISYEDALAEGAMDGAKFCEALEPGKRNALGESAEETAKRLQWPQRSFERLWASINGQASWDANPWVWAITFQPVTPCP